MARKNTPAMAFDRFHRPIEKALGCITAQRLLIPQRHTLVPDRPYSIVLAEADPVPLDGLSSVTLSVSHQFKIVKKVELENGPFKATTLRYEYQFATSDGDNLITFHWAPDTNDIAQKTYPHMHIGTSMLSKETPILPGRFNKAHIPTGRVSIESVVRFAIEELGVRPLKRDWQRALDRSEATFHFWSRRPT